MAWTAPRTYVANEVVTAAIFNVDLRDNLLALSTHAHGGAAGAGNDELAGVDSIAFDDIAASPDAPGELQRKGANLEWYGAAVVKFTEADAAAASASPRTLGTGALQASAGNHTHSLLEDAKQDATTGDANEPGSIAFFAAPGASTNTDADASVTASKALRLAGGGSIVYTNGVAGDTYDFSIDGVSVASGTATAASSILVMGGSRDVSSGARIVRMRHTTSGTAGTRKVRVQAHAIAISL